MASHSPSRNCCSESSASAGPSASNQSQSPDCDYVCAATSTRSVDFDLQHTTYLPCKSESRCAVHPVDSNQNVTAPSCNACNAVDVVGMPELPEIPELILCLHFPGTDGWHDHWICFNKKVKDFHKSMIDFNWKILEWYALKAKQLERFGVRTPYVAGTLITGPRITIILAQTLTESDVLAEIKRCLPDHVNKEVKSLETRAYKLCLSGKIFLFDKQQVIVIDYAPDSEKSYRNCLKFSLFYKNEKVNIFGQYNRVYGGLKYSFAIGGLGALMVSYLTGYFDAPSLNSRRCNCAESVSTWMVAKRVAALSIIYSISERVLLLKFTKPQKHIISGTTGFLCGTLIGLCDNCHPEQIVYAASEFGIFALLSNMILKKHITQGTLGGGCPCGEDGI